MHLLKQYNMKRCDKVKKNRRQLKLLTYLNRALRPDRPEIDSVVLHKNTLADL